MALLSRTAAGGDVWREHILFWTSAARGAAVTRRACRAVRPCVALARLHRSRVRAAGRRRLPRLDRDVVARGAGRGRHARHVRRRFQGPRAGSTSCPISNCPAGRPRRARPGRVHAPAVRVSRQGLPRRGSPPTARRCSPSTRRRSRRSSATSASTAIRCSPSGAARPPSARQQGSVTTPSRPGDAGLRRPAQGALPHRADRRAAHARGRRAARQDALVLGRRHGPHAVHADRVFQARPRSRRRRHDRHLELHSRCARLRRAPARRARAGCRGETWGYEVRLSPARRLLARRADAGAHHRRMGQARRRPRQRPPVDRAAARPRAPIS